MLFDLGSLSDVESLLVGFLVCLVGGVISYFLSSVGVGLGSVVSLILMIVLYFVLVRGNGSLKYYLVGYFLTFIVVVFLLVVVLGGFLFLTMI